MYSISSSIFAIAKPHLFAPLLTETAYDKEQRSYCHDLSALLRSMQKAASEQKHRPADPSADLSMMVLCQDLGLIK